MLVLKDIQEIAPLDKLGDNAQRIDGQSDQIDNITVLQATVAP